MSIWTRRQHRRLAVVPLRLASFGLLLACLATGLPVGAQLEAEHAADSGAEAAKRKGLEAAIGNELEYQSNLLRNSRGEGGSEAGKDELLGDTSPRVAPGPPKERELPIAIFDSERKSIPPGTWGNRDRLKVLELTLDADGDGKPELVRWIDRESKLRIRQEEDRNYDGITDAWSDYEWGEIVARVLDSNDDGNPDVWELYSNGRMTSREIDRDDDGVRDAFYRYAGDSLREERYDSNNDSQIDLIVRYENRIRVSVEEDQDTDGKMDTWTSYITVDGHEVVARIERDTLGEGTITNVAIFDTESGRAVIARRDEDIDGDGDVDVVSIYRKGKLVRREISDPTLVEL